jgi:hypothetical protein
VPVRTLLEVSMSFRFSPTCPPSSPASSATTATPSSRCQRCLTFSASLTLRALLHLCSKLCVRAPWGTASLTLRPNTTERLSLASLFSLFYHKAGILPSGAPTALNRKYQIRLKSIAGGKHTGLFCRSVWGRRKKFKTLTSGSGGRWWVRPSPHPLLQRRGLQHDRVQHYLQVTVMFRAWPLL